MAACARDLSRPDGCRWQVLAIVFTSPQLLERWLPPTSRRNRLLLVALRRVHKLLEAIA